MVDQSRPDRDRSNKAQEHEFNQSANRRGEFSRPIGTLQGIEQHNLSLPGIELI